MNKPLTVTPKLRPPLDSDFLPAALWNRAYRALVSFDPQSRPVALALRRADGIVSVHHDRVLAATHPSAVHTLNYLERLLKFLLWQKGGSQVSIAGADETAAVLARIYSPSGSRAFDHGFMGKTVDRQTFTFSSCGFDDLPTPRKSSLAIGRHFDGCRIGFDLGGSDRKTAAVIGGRVVFSEEIAWAPYFEKNPAYHIAGVNDSIARAAAHLPRVDAIGGSAAGIYVNNEVRVASLFRGVPPVAFERHIRRMFLEIQRSWKNVPLTVADDGSVTALAGSIALEENAVLGISMGTSQAGGYVTPDGNVSSWLNELAFAPVDYRPDAPSDEWSGDAGCGVQYFSQQAVGRLASRAGFDFPATLGLSEQLAAVQKAMGAGDPRAQAIYESIGVCLGYAIAHYADFYDFRSALVLGRVTSGEGGTVLIARAEDVLRAEFPSLAEKIRLRLPDETSKRLGQAIAAASLPALR